MGVDIEKLEALAKAATPLPWRVETEVTRDGWGLLWPITSIESGDDNVAENLTTGDAAYILAACNAAPELIARVRELERQREWLAKKCEELSDDVEDSFMPYHIPAKEWIKRAEHAAKDE